MVCNNKKKVQSSTANLKLTSQNLSATMYRTRQDLSLAALLSVGMTRVSTSGLVRRLAMAAQASTANRRTESYWGKYTKEV